MNDYIVNIEGVSKEFPGVKALSDVSLKVKKGEVHCLMGENGAGKSTLINILAGLLDKDSGTIRIDGSDVSISSPHEAHQKGISFIFQELSVVEALTVEENMTLGLECHKAGIVDRKTNTESVKSILNKLNIKIDPGAQVKQLSVCEKQMMLIAKALSSNSRIIVMDEPTASLTHKEVEDLFKIIRELKVTGVTFIFVSHRFDDIFAIGDTITVFRDGRNAGVLNVSETNEDEIIRHMVGRDINETFPKRNHDIGEVVLKVQELCAKELVKNVSFELRKGQVLGVSGLAGAGKSELARALFGDNHIENGSIELNGKRVRFRNCRDAIKAKVAYLPEERRAQGIVGVLSVRENISIVAHEIISKLHVIIGKKDRELANKYIKEIRIKTPSAEQMIKYLSGGNQQKAIIGKWLATEADIFLLDEPTRGIDIGAKSEIYELINNLTKLGKAVMIFSSELPELLGVSDNILVMSDGKLAGELVTDETDQEEIMKLSVGGL